MKYDYLKNISATPILDNISLKAKQQVYLLTMLNNLPVMMAWKMGEGLTFAHAIYYIEKMLFSDTQPLYDMITDENNKIYHAENNYALIATIKSLLKNTRYELKQIQENYTIIAKAV